MRYQATSFLGAAILGSAGFLGATVVGQAAGERSAAVSDRQAAGEGLRSAAIRQDRRYPAPRAMKVGDPPSCPDGPNLSWVTTVRPLPDCFGFGDLFNGDVADWNGDGQVEFISERDIVLLEVGTPQPSECIAVVSRVEWDGAQATLSRSCIATSDLLIAYCQATFAGSTVVMESVGCRDIDGDGDLDAAVLLAIDNWASSRWVWLENTGYEASNGIAGDINRDGAIDGKDLAIVLAGWTG